MKSYLLSGFIATGDFVAPSRLLSTCNRKLANEAMMPSRMLRQMQTNHSELKDKLLRVFRRKKREQPGEKRLLRITTSTNVNVLEASYLMGHCIAKVNKAFTIGEERILSARWIFSEKFVERLELKR